MAVSDDSRAYWVDSSGLQPLCGRGILSCGKWRACIGLEIAGAPCPGCQPRLICPDETDADSPLTAKLKESLDSPDIKMRNWSSTGTTWGGLWWGPYEPTGSLY
jgi:hypothetical protein